MLTRPQITIGLVGARFAASFHLDAYRRVYGVDVRVKGVTSRDPASAARFAQEHSLEVAYPSVDDLLADPEVQWVDLCCPNAFHEPLAVRAASAGKHVVCEKPLTGYFGGDRGKTLESVPRDLMFREAMAGAERIAEAVRKAGRFFGYAENWVYAPAVQKARRLLAQSDNTILRIVGEESHSGTHSPYAMEWRTSGGGALLNKGCHPLGAALYLKYDEGRRKAGKPIKPKAVTAEVAHLTRIPSFVAEPDKFIRTGWVDCEDWGSMLVTFEDGSVAQITAGDTTLGGIHNVLRVLSSKSVIDCNINPNTSVVAYAPSPATFGQEYLREKLETKAGWNFTNPDEDWSNGFYNEFQDFCESAVAGRPPQSGIELARDIVIVGYAAYVSAATGQRVDLTPYFATSQ
ncbi:MAG: Gfo/Idh/MocA family oxidoreductase [Planctomycetes bacterium]|nr:Gfo/Idh/MocA family oxidoreductase [Planctomycetota bacterium]